MGVIRDQSEKIFTGAITTRQFHPLLPTGEYEEIADGVMFYRWFANVTAARTREGLVLIDTGGYFNQDATVKLIRRLSRMRRRTRLRGRASWGIVQSRRASIATSAPADTTQ